MTRIILLAIMISCPLLAFAYVYIRFHRTPKEDKWYDTIIYILWPLLATCVGVVVALWIDRDETLRRQKEATVKTLTLCILDVNNAIELIERSLQTAEKYDGDAGTLETYRSARTLLERFGIPYPDVVQSMLLSESMLTNCTSGYLETVMRELNKLKQLKASIERCTSEEQYFYYIDSYHIALSEIFDLTGAEINFLNGLISKSEHDRRIDIVMEGKRRMKKLGRNAEQRKELFGHEEQAGRE